MNAAPRKTPHAVLAGLDERQKAVAQSVSGPLAVIAGAGTGKTRAITHRLAYAVAVGAMAPESILALTFTTRAAGELRERVRLLGVGDIHAATFHSAALSQLRYFWPHAVGGPFPRIISHITPLVGAACARIGRDDSVEAAREYAAHIQKARVSLLPAQNYAEQYAHDIYASGITPEDYCAVVREYEEAKSRERVIDFDDCLLILIGLLLDRPDIARQVREVYQNFVVDEFQDISPMQFRLLELWLGGRSQICVVGDPSQTIYTFAGAKSEYLMNFSHYFPQAKRIELIDNYRCSGNIVAVANTVIAGGNVGNSQPALRLRAQRPQGTSVSWEMDKDEESERIRITKEISALIKNGVKESDIAVLVRTRFLVSEFAQTLEKNGIRTSTASPEEYYSHPYVMSVLRGFESIARADTTARPSQAMKMLIEREGWQENPPTEMGNKREKWENLQALYEFALNTEKKYRLVAKETEGDQNRTHAEKNPTQKTPKFADTAAITLCAQRLAAYAQSRKPLQSSGVNVVSLHAAKGLEWKEVFLARLIDGILPISRANSPQAIEEERRLLYVGITRARDHLHLSYPQASQSSEQTEEEKTQKIRTYRPSRFLEPLWPAKEKGSSRASKTREHHHALLAHLQENPHAWELFCALQLWREHLAQALGVLPSQILTDTVLARIAQNPSSALEDLRNVRGLGSAKIAAYGQSLHTALNDFLGEKEHHTRKN